MCNFSIHHTNAPTHTCLQEQEALPKPLEPGDLVVTLENWSLRQPETAFPKQMSYFFITVLQAHSWLNIDDSPKYTYYTTKPISLGGNSIRDPISPSLSPLSAWVKPPSPLAFSILPQYSPPGISATHTQGTHTNPSSPVFLSFAPHRRHIIKLANAISTCTLTTLPPPSAWLTPSYHSDQSPKVVSTAPG